MEAEINFRFMGQGGQIMHEFAFVGMSCNVLIRTQVVPSNE
jgi:hypothetical protein